MKITERGSDEANRIAQRIASLRATSERNATSAFEFEPDIDAAESIQDSCLQTVPNGWKVAKSPQGIAVVSPLHPFVTGSNALVWRTGTMIEVEIAVALREYLPVRLGHAYTRGEVLDAVEGFYLGVELVRSVLNENGRESFSLFLADRMGNDGYYLGPVFPRAELEEVQSANLKLRVDGAVIYDADARHSNGDCLGWLVDFANRADRKKDSLRAGVVLTTGSLCGGVPLTTPGVVAVRVGGREFFCSILPAENPKSARVR
ncbi:2-keto-4-pentenoate hydratase [Ensifer sp. MMN_5]|nr:2-keto-4-pentenoate hydratase [Ensifer sp. MMN_5]